MQHEGTFQKQYLIMEFIHKWHMLYINNLLTDLIWSNIIQI